MDDLAVKVGLGYGDNGNDGVFSYKVGGKYYIMGNIPVGLDLNGASVDGFSPMYLGVQAGYAVFLGEHVSIEPGLRYDYGFNDDAGKYKIEFNINDQIILNIFDSHLFF